MKDSRLHNARPRVCLRVKLLMDAMTLVHAIALSSAAVTCYDFYFAP